MSHSLGISKNSQRTKTNTPFQYRSLEQLTIYNVIAINNLICLMITFLSTERSTSWYEIMHFPELGNLPVIGDFPHNCGWNLSDFAFEISGSFEATEHRTDWIITIIASGLHAVYY
jgi:hypothetical protein